MFADPSDPLRRLASDSLPVYTGYAPEMIDFTLGALQWMSLEHFPAAFRQNPLWSAAHAWQAMPELPGLIYFTPQSAGAPSLNAVLARLAGRSTRPILTPCQPPGFILGFASGNVPGAALLLGFLSLGICLAGAPPPAVVIRNSRSEPIFSPLVFSALEQIDPALVSSLSALVWEHDDAHVRKILAPQADLAIAAASDDSIEKIQALFSPPTRFHAHGHKVSFAAIGCHAMLPGLVDTGSGQSMLEVVTTLAALDSIFWDQHGCLSARVHFVEQSPSTITAEAYCDSLVDKLRWLERLLPRGAWPRQQLFDSFDRYAAMQTTGLVRIISRYEDPFVVVLDHRPPQVAPFRELVNACQGRVIAVCPVENLMQIPEQYLKLLAPRNLQSLCLLAGVPGSMPNRELLVFAQACAQKGITAIRSLGRGAFPQLAYSWDGLLPLDFVSTRSAGYFSTIEFNDLYSEVSQTYRALIGRARDSLL